MNITCLIVNYNCLFHTYNLLADIKKQTYNNYELIIVDQGSIEIGTHGYLDRWEADGHIVIRNKSNESLNQIWNDTIKYSHSPIVSFLNNDIRIPPNFLQDTWDIFDRERDVTCVIHPTNNPIFHVKDKLEYVVLEERTMQGWDFSFRKDDWIDIPADLKFYCGDDFIFENLYLREKKVAMALSSPITHLRSQTKKSELNKSRLDVDAEQDIINYKKLGFSHYLDMLNEYSKGRPPKNHWSSLKLQCKKKIFTFWQNWCLNR